MKTRTPLKPLPQQQKCTSCFAPTVDGMAYFGAQTGCGQGDGRYWHLADIGLCAAHVRF
jgi:hypothetical protein